MTTLRDIYVLLCEDFAGSRHIVWENEGTIGNDVTHTLRLVVQAAQGLRRRDQAKWRELVTYCLDRSLSEQVLVAIDDYLVDCGYFPELPLITFTEPKCRNWQGGTVPLLDETDVAQMNARTEKPEADREIILKRQKWSHENPLCTRMKHPKPTKKTASTHWLFTS